MSIKTPDVLPGEPGYISKKDRTKEKRIGEKKEKIKKEKIDVQIGNIRLGGKGYRIGRPKITPKREKKYVIWRFAKRIGEISVAENGEITLKFFRFGKVANYKNLIQDVDFQKEWMTKEQELLMTQKECYLCRAKISKSAKPNLYHINLWKKQADLLEKADEVPSEVIEGKISVEDGWKKFHEILEEGNRYYMSLKETALICAACAKKKGLSY
jgi:predicted transport protein